MPLLPILMPRLYTGLHFPLLERDLFPSKPLSTLLLDFLNFIRKIVHTHKKILGNPEIKAQYPPSIHKAILPPPLQSQYPEVITVKSLAYLLSNLFLCIYKYIHTHKYTHGLGFYKNGVTLVCYIWFFNFFHPMYRKFLKHKSDSIIPPEFIISHNI